MPPRDNFITLEGVDLTFRNFAGKARQFNDEGDRNFSVLLNEEQAEDLTRRGLNVKRLRPRGDEKVGQAHLKVTVSYKVRTPTLVLVTGKGKTELPEDMAELMDKVDIETCDVILNIYNWSVNGNSGRKAYADSVYLVVYQDQLALKYKDVPEIGMSRERPAIERGPKALEAAYLEAEVLFDSDEQSEEIPF